MVKINRTGETRLMNCDMNATIIKYENNKDITVVFDNGIIVEHKKYLDFTKGKVSYCSVNQYKEEEYIGTEKVAKNGLKMRIIAYREYNDIDIEFEDRVICRNLSISSFNKGEIKHPGVKIKRVYKHKITNKTKIEKFKNKYIGLSKTIKKTNKKMTIIAYRNNNDIDIKIDDNIILKHKTIKDFKNSTMNYQYKRINEIKKMSNGLYGEIIKYNESNSVEVKFYDGTIVNSNYAAFKRGYIKHPKFDNFIKNKINDKYYKCICKKCGLEAVMTSLEIINHKC